MIRLRRPAVAAVGLLTLAAAVALPLWTLADGTTSHATGKVPSGSTVTSVPTATATAQATDAGAVSLPGPIIKQDLALDCESAALQVALAVRNIEVPQDRIYASMPQDPRPVQLGSDGYPVRWGDPYTAFVGDVNGYEPDFTGYGVYYPPIVAAAERYGAVAEGRTGWTIAEIVAQLHQGNAVVIWLTSDFKAHIPRYWTAWDGTRVPWAIGEHAVPVIGFDPERSTITFVDVLVGVQRTMTTQAFAAAMTTFGGMGVAVSSGS
ncbi:MAG TPA: C39 family peptidase [Candidatus Saccharimonadales bacterium]|nr:C39 family peptidase [Candidatus Saccharimonadales bacterium]